jgi:hypothetical protein
LKENMKSLLPNLFAGTCLISLSMITAATPVKAMERQTVAHPYPKAVVQKLMNDCTSAGQRANPEFMRQACSCAVQIFQDHYTLEQYAELDRDVISGKNRSRELNQVIKLCAEATLKLQAGERP